jgi:hypothetical protein
MSYRAKTDRLWDRVSKLSLKRLDLRMQKVTLHPPELQGPVAPPKDAKAGNAPQVELAYRNHVECWIYKDKRHETMRPHARKLGIQYPFSFRNDCRRASRLGHAVSTAAL